MAAGDIARDGGGSADAAAFSDVDGTLIDGGMLRMFFTMGRDLGIFSRARIALVAILAIVSRALPAKLRRDAQILSVLIVMRGQTVPDIQRLVDAITPVYLQRLKPGTLARLRGHQRDGLALVLMSAALHEAVVRLATELGGRGEGTKIHRRDGRYLARFDGPVCQGRAKAARALAVAAEMGYDPATSYAYGDTASDILLLAAVGHPCAVDPDPVLAVEAQRRGWPILNGGLPSS